MQFRSIITVLALAMTATALPAAVENQVGAEVVARTDGSNNHNNNPSNNCQNHQQSACCNHVVSTLFEILPLDLVGKLTCSITGLIGGVAGTCNGVTYCCNAQGGGGSAVGGLITLNLLNNNCIKLA
ncbi:hypothetical protein VTJ83DRAFT_6131 [Remersonia thermophila]|uniref:Hydrophobin n=1 Tax=Remersonia thermophila TaxID=72144 RepID=A0ABR4D9R7_9PEZI